MNELFSPPSFNNINIPEEFGLSRELFFFDNPDEPKHGCSLYNNSRRSCSMTNVIRRSKI
ncbi:hypothetical protein RirG_161570 [Rhizophagus irregularis DAOM 197198w]|uniref:Uncharacterized protein n=1 Tax=Rhizophagus irregularis (strain DAOM 197198w) TaxID=1432141 RepID=A0A015M6J2_RHIIW|nr:hypothetical protein RirG_161570 [Rhizophagus irregularis DAOM 197198w]